MKLLLDECVPKRAKFLFSAAGHVCETAREAGFGGKENGELLALIENSFDALVTIDQNMRYQQNIRGRKIAILVIHTASSDLEDIRPHVAQALAALRTIQPGQFVEVGP
jgi:predicted nuclease of predicted toxin-antitoxin system